jgi:hypothetical protein
MHKKKSTNMSKNQLQYYFNTLSIINENGVPPLALRDRQKQKARITAAAGGPGILFA